jgi:Ca-activated chloride channel family protein
LALPLLGFLLQRKSRHPQASIQYSNAGLFRGIHPGRALAWRRALPLLRLLALAFIILALARPRYGVVERDVIQEGVDIFYVLDISGSMLAEDFHPNRLEKAKEITKAFAAKRLYDRQGIVLFAGEAFMLCPLTFDNGTVQNFLDSVGFDDVGEQGTAIGLGLARALKKLQDSKAKSKVIILLTDGDENVFKIRPEDAVKVAQKLDVHIYTVGIGSRGLATVTVQTPQGPRRQTIRADINERLLESVASETGGVYRRATTATELAEIFDEIDKLEKSEIETREYRSYDERMALPAWIALAFLMLEFVLARTRFIKIP